ncbi:hypothetical protein AB0K81_32530 [Streptomyces werraensis]|uniref:Uncharacterized protein n=1 Tax=Streptomyces werraensis TaxID=68284 RepID=A0ABV3JN14_9ACTN
MTHPHLPVTWSPVHRDPPAPGDLTLTAPSTSAGTPGGEAVRAYLERLRQVAQLAAGHGYRPIARALRPPPERVHAMARAGARLLLRDGTAPEELRDALANLPPLEPPPQRRPRPRRKPAVDLDALANLPAYSGDLDDLTAAPELNDLAVPLADLDDLTADALSTDPDLP